jgi:hypothetical protein
MRPATKKKQVKAVPAGTQYTCPMHPQILQDTPGACPLCGMALEPLIATDEPSHELVDFTRRMWISAAAAVPLIILTMGGFAGKRRSDGHCARPQTRQSHPAQYQTESVFRLRL